MNGERRTGTTLDGLHLQLFQSQEEEGSAEFPKKRITTAAEVRPTTSPGATTRRSEAASGSTAVPTFVDT